MLELLAVESRHAMGHFEKKHAIGDFEKPQVSMNFGSYIYIC